MGHTPSVLPEGGQLLGSCGPDEPLFDCGANDLGDCLAEGDWNPVGDLLLLSGQWAVEDEGVGHPLQASALTNGEDAAIRGVAQHRLARIDDARTGSLQGRPSGTIQSGDPHRDGPRPNVSGYCC